MIKAIRFYGRSHSSSRSNSCSIFSDFFLRSPFSLSIFVFFFTVERPKYDLQFSGLVAFEKNAQFVFVRCAEFFVQLINQMNMITLCNKNSPSQGHTQTHRHKTNVMRIHIVCSGRHTRQSFWAATHAICHAIKFRTASICVFSLLVGAIFMSHTNNDNNNNSQRLNATTQGKLKTSQNYLMGWGVMRFPPT